MTVAIMIGPRITAQPSKGVSRLVKNGTTTPASDSTYPMPIATTAHMKVDCVRQMCNAKLYITSAWTEELERLCALHDPATIAAAIVKPMARSTGVPPPPEGYPARLREICTRHGILLIFDEVITAFGRLGTATAFGLWGVTPDILTMAKGLNNAAVPIGGAVSDAI
jgi:adenosylmethionine-8-amino-7-oxononanoate aminotransferase